MLKMQLMLLTLIFAVTTGCSTMSGGKQEITNQSLVSQIKPDQTTKSRVLKLLGQPQAIELNENSETWVYQHRSVSMDTTNYIPVVALFKTTYGTAKTTTFSILIGNDGIVKKVRHIEKTCVMERHDCR